MKRIIATAILVVGVSGVASAQNPAAILNSVTGLTAGTPLAGLALPALPAIPAVPGLPALAVPALPAVPGLGALPGLGVPALPALPGASLVSDTLPSLLNPSSLIATGNSLANGAMVYLSNARTLPVLGPVPAVIPAGLPALPALPALPTLPGLAL